jgi:hypothetical protein
MENYEIDVNKKSLPPANLEEVEVLPVEIDIGRFPILDNIISNDNILKHPMDSIID